MIKYSLIFLLFLCCNLLSFSQNKIDVLDFISTHWNIKPETYNANSELILFLNIGDPIEPVTIFDTSTTFYNGFKLQYIYNHRDLEKYMDKKKTIFKKNRKDYLVVEVTLNRLLEDGNLLFNFFLFHINPRTYNSKIPLKHIGENANLKGVLNYDSEKKSWNWVDGKNIRL